MIRIIHIKEEAPWRGINEAAGLVSESMSSAVRGLGEGVWGVASGGQPWHDAQPLFTRLLFTDTPTGAYPVHLGGGGGGVCGVNFFEVDLLMFPVFCLFVCSSVFFSLFVYIMHSWYDYFRVE